MPLEVWRIREFYLTISTREGSFTSVSTQMWLEIGRERELGLTISTREGLFTSVGTHMRLEVWRFREPSHTISARERFANWASWRWLCSRSVALPSSLGLLLFRILGCMVVGTHRLSWKSNNSPKWFTDSTCVFEWVFGNICLCKKVNNALTQLYVLAYTPYNGSLHDVRTCLTLKRLRTTGLQWRQYLHIYKASYWVLTSLAITYIYM